MADSGRNPQHAKHDKEGPPVSKTRLRLGEVRRRPRAVGHSPDAEMIELLPDPSVEVYLRNLEDKSLRDP